MYQQHIVVVGGGIIGLSTAYALLKQGVKQVTVLEQAHVDHQRAASHGLSRLLRFEYGADVLYSEMVQLSLNRWRNLEHLSHKALCTPTDFLVLGNEDDNFTRPSYHALNKLGLPTRYLSRQHCQQLFPQFNTRGYNLFTHNTQACILHASRCLRTLRALILDLGGVIYESHCVTHITHDKQSRPIRLHSDTNRELSADRVVLALGPWVHRLLGYLSLPVRLTCQYGLYFANLPVSIFGLDAFPAFFAGELYGLPIYNTCTDRSPSWLKATNHTFGPPFKLDEELCVNEDVIAKISEQVCHLLPALRCAELVHVESCVYDVSPDEGFILDTLPDDPRIVFATGLSGHAFKFGPVLGELLSSLVRERQPIIPMEHFQLARFSQIVQNVPVA